jgi:hypothetical protein
VFYEVQAMDVQMTDTLASYKYLIFNWLLFILFIAAVIELLDKHIPIKAALKRLIEWIFRNLKL